MAEEKKGMWSLDNFLGFLNIAHASHVLKLRQSWKASPQLRIDAGLDYDVGKNATKPYAGIRMLMNGPKQDSWAVEFNTDMAVLCTPKVDLLPFTSAMSLPVDLRIGRDFYNNDAPHFEVGLHNSKVALGLLVVALITKKPIRVKRKETGGFSAEVPFKLRSGASVPHTLQGRSEVDATLVRRGLGLNLEVHEWNPIIRLRQDD